ncbi:hypothetical protein H5410_060311 [Solanum commersonii]|uniref:Uncharacterized protein n=1 Tax=Solanum commersonii TaxID=4109 RepID=A0A9J5W545_SOLCO|nr:hypothetical protein H5410_060311 [Solanum commersonii]
MTKIEIDDDELAHFVENVDKDNDITFEEMRKFILLYPHEGTLENIYQYCLVDIGIEIHDDEVARFVEHVYKNNNGIIAFEEWRNFLLLYPHEATLENIYQ